MNHTAVIVTPRDHHGDVGGWNPWRELRERDGLELGIVDLPALAGRGLYAQRGEARAILLSKHLGRRERNEVLAHELVHDERGGGCARPQDAPRGWQAIVAREERAVDRIVAERLVPLEELDEFCKKIADIEGGVTAEMVAEEFDTTVAMAELSLVLLAGQERERNP